LIAQRKAPWPAAGVVVAFLVACGSNKPPQSVEELDALTNDAASEAIKEGAPLAWAEAKRYLDMARQMEEEGDLEQADRFAALGAIQLKVAQTRAAHAAAKKRLAEAELKKQALTEEKNRLLFVIERMETEVERERLRRHLTEVVAQTRLEAAAAEEIEERYLKKEQKKMITSARYQVGYEMLSRAEVWKEVADIVTREEMLGSDTSTVNGALALAREALQRRDLAGVQQYVEEAGRESRRLVDDAFESCDASRGNLEELLSKLGAAGLTVTSEDIGPVLEIGAPPSKPREKRNAWLKDVSRLGEIVAPFPQIHCLVLTADHGTKIVPAAEKSSVQLAEAVRGALIDAGVSESLVHAEGLGPASPLPPLMGEGDRVAVVFVPVSERAP
jgi:hypothetical protein